MVDITEQILTSLRTIDTKVDGIDKKVAVYGKSIKLCEEDRKIIKTKANGMSTDITVLKTQKKTSEKNKSNYFDVAVRVITILCTIALATMWGIKLARGGESPQISKPYWYCDCAVTKYCECNKDFCNCVECRTMLKGNNNGIKKG